MVLGAIRMSVDDYRFLASFVFWGFCSISAFRLQHEKMQQILHQSRENHRIVKHNGSIPVNATAHQASIEQGTTQDERNNTGSQR